MNFYKKMENQRIQFNYKRVLKHWIEHWESNDNEFTADKMLNYCDSHVSLPHLDDLFQS